jgi:hypothetical protein
MPRPVTKGKNVEQLDVDRIFRALKRAREFPSPLRSRQLNDELVELLERVIVIYNSNTKQKGRQKKAA